MLRTLLKLSFVALTTFQFTVGIAQDKQTAKERIQASYLLALGRTPNDGEINYWSGQGNLSVSQLVANHKKFIAQDNGTRRAVIMKSYVDALGYNPTEAEINHHAQYNRTYTEMMNNHMLYITQLASEYEKVIKRSYKAILGKDPSTAEINYWKGQGPLSYMVLVACHDDWKSKNGSGSSTTSGVLNTSNKFISSVSISASVLSETKAALSTLISASGGKMVAAGGGNMVAAGGGNMVAAGGGNMVAAGGGNMVAAGGGN